MRARIINAALSLIEKEGFSAVTALRLAAEIGLKRPIIYYYFKDIDEVTLEAVRLAYSEAKHAALSEVSDRGPTLPLWGIFRNAAAPLAELTALALRNEKFRALYQEIMDDLRSRFAPMQSTILDRMVTSESLDAEGFTLLIQIVSTALATESRLGLSIGHESLERWTTAQMARAR